MNQQKTNSFIPLSLLLLLGTIWGTGYSIARFAVTNGVHPFGYSFWQSLGPALILTTLILIRKKPFNYNWQHVRYYLVCGITGIIVPNTTMYYSAYHLPASILAIVVNTVPIIAYPMALYVGLERLNGWRMIGILLAILGLMLIIVPKASLPTASAVPWVLLTLITPFSFAFCSIYIARYRPFDSDALSLSAGMLLASTLLLIPIVYMTDSMYWLQLPFTPPDWIILLEILLSSLGYVLFFKLITIAGPVYYSLVDTIVVITGISWGYIIFNEPINRYILLAVACIITALLLVTWQQHRYQKGT